MFTADDFGTILLEGSQLVFPGRGGLAPPALVLLLGETGQAAARLILALTIKGPSRSLTLTPTLIKLGNFPSNAFWAAAFFSLSSASSNSKLRSCDAVSLYMLVVAMVLPMHCRPPKTKMHQVARFRADVWKFPARWVQDHMIFAPDIGVMVESMVTGRDRCLV